MLRPFTMYCTVFAVAGIVLNGFFLMVTRLQRVERVQEVLIFLRGLSVGYIFVALAIMAVAPQSITLGTTNIRVPHGLLIAGNTGVSSNFMNGLAAFGVGCFLFTVLTFSLLFLYHYRKTNGQMSTVFAPKNIPVFLTTFALFCLVQAVLLFYTKVDPNYLIERLSRSKKWEEIQVSFGFNASSMSFGPNGLGTKEGFSGVFKDNNYALSQPQIQQGNQQGNQNYTTNMLAAMEKFDGNGGNGAVDGRVLEGTFGTDYTRNPLYFLSYGVLTFSFILASLVTITIPAIVTCNLCGRQESMSDKSQEELMRFTVVLMLESYLPTILVACAGANYIVCKVMGESLFTFQEFLSMLLIAPVPAVFPLINLILLKEFRHITWQILSCAIWTRKQRQKKAAAERKALENIDEELASASRNKHKNKHMKSNAEISIASAVQAAAASVADGVSASTINSGDGSSAKPRYAGNSVPEESNRYCEPTDNAHRQARALFGKQE